MTTAIRSEFLKFFTTRLWWGMAIGIFVAGGLFAGFFGWALTSEASRKRPGAPQGDATQIANTVYTSGMGVGYLLLLTIGVLMIGAEYRHKTITSTFLATPKRLQAMLAKVVALLVIGALYGLISIVSSVGVGATVLKLAGHDPFPSSEVFRTMALSLLVLGLWGLIGLGVGILIKNQVAALLIGIGVAWIVEPVAGLLLGFWDFGAEHIVKYLPSQATSAVVNSVTQGGQQVARLEWWAGALVLAAYAAVLAGFGIWRTLREDVS
ncbi:MAG TPA: ABC transporter permease subunit [Phycicoccus elongatus]|jgi:ABC-type transport system involved in multi-copper enzyme maturation permease subunit|uniref:ABC transporter permease subunit n=1 Tax=Phycicoccus TaxID=367298 RepID=UPI002C639CBC|nr:MULTISPECIES: ABC transporter permease subunit [Phycicoccus]HOA65778.1 ABC transporter permease subunit [Phycicoccus elongatus]HPF75089.1 ABC transporter permease subunit [Phycicoccus elongatus]HPK11161.1 ABC transporter permease subunit [Phycicoccus elongatus]HPQ72719.1 ABC transporter permease subunit [Phycicoccus elongatus]HRC16663.1 ABC transporter permease subunit [Phycicoccus elongatus]